jgi:hypothetical protein
VGGRHVGRTGRTIAPRARRKPLAQRYSRAECNDVPTQRFASSDLVIADRDGQHGGVVLLLPLLKTSDDGPLFRLAGGCNSPEAASPGLRTSQNRSCRRRRHAPALVDRMQRRTGHRNDASGRSSLTDVVREALAGLGCVIDFAPARCTMDESRGEGKCVGVSVCGFFSQLSRARTLASGHARAER